MPDELVWELPLVDPALLVSLESLRWSVGRFGSLLADDEESPLSLSSFRCRVGLPESASFTTCGGCFDMGGFALTITISGFTAPIAIHEPPRFWAPLTLNSPLGVPACSSS